MGLGDAFFAARRTGEAERAWQELSVRSEGDGPVLARLGALLRALGRDSEGDRLLVAARQAAPEDPEILEDEMFDEFFDDQ